MKRTMLNLVMIVVLVLVAVPAADAALVINDFRDLINAPSGTQSQFVAMNDAIPENLMIRGIFGIDNVVSNDGTEIWRIGFYKDFGDHIEIGGYANTDNHNAKTYPGYEGWCRGTFYGHVFNDGDLPDGVYVIHDLLGDGMGILDNGEWFLGLDDAVYTTVDIEFNGILGDISQMTPIDLIGDRDSNILPQLTIVPEPTTLALFGLGLIFTRIKRLA